MPSEAQKRANKKYQQTQAYKDYKRIYNKKRAQSEGFKEKNREYMREYMKKYRRIPIITI